MFKKPASYPFWMKDMRFSLDFIWISNRKVVQISENVLPPDASHPVPTTITPDPPPRHPLYEKKSQLRTTTQKKTKKNMKNNTVLVLLHILIYFFFFFFFFFFLSCCSCLPAVGPGCPAVRG